MCIIYTHEYLTRLFCTYRFEFKGIIDYIFYSKQSMVPLGLLGPLSPEWFKEHKVVGCPHPHVPSGEFHFMFHIIFTHIPLMKVRMALTFCFLF